LLNFSSFVFTFISWVCFPNTLKDNCAMCT
jgi:hypothetical protein